MTSDVQLQPMTAEEFDAWVLLPENHDRNFEFIAGEIIEVVSNQYATEVTAMVTTYIGMYLIKNRIGRLTSAEGGYMISGERCIPDAAYTSFAKRPKSFREAYPQVAPDLAVEVISNPKNPQDHIILRRKITAYLAVGTTVWVFDIDDKFIEAHAPGKAPKVYEINDTLDGGDILPRFSVPVKDLFPPEEVE